MVQAKLKLGFSQSSECPQSFIFIFIYGIWLCNSSYFKCALWINLMLLIVWSPTCLSLQHSMSQQSLHRQTFSNQNWCDFLKMYFCLYFDSGKHWGDWTREDIERMSYNKGPKRSETMGHCHHVFSVLKPGGDRDSTMLSVHHDVACDIRPCK